MRFEYKFILQNIIEPQLVECNFKFDEFKGQEINSPPRKYFFDVKKDFGAIGDGVHDDTPSFKKAIYDIDRKYLNSTLYVPKGDFLISPINLTSYMTLFLEKDSRIVGTSDMNKWAVIEPLPSYGQGRDHEGPRHTSLIHGINLHDLAIAGNNGTIDGQGKVWWDFHKSGQEKITRGSLVEFLNCSQIFIENITLINSPFWTLHPWNSVDIYVNLLTVLNPIDSPNTDGIDPDSVNGMVIQNSYVTCGDDGVAIKSGWDCFGLDFNVPAQNILIRNLTVNHGHAGVGIGSEMSGGVRNITVENCHFINVTSGGVRLKSAIGRGSYIENVTYDSIRITNDVKGAILNIEEDYGGNNPTCKGRNITALPTIKNIFLRNIQGVGKDLPAVSFAGQIGQPLSEIYLENITLNVPSNETSKVFKCETSSGFYKNVFPVPCQNFKQINQQQQSEEDQLSDEIQ